MKKMKARFLSLLLAVVMVIGTMGTALAADESTDTTDNYTVTFEVSEGVTVDIYYDKDTYEEDADAEPDETNVTVAYAREKGDSALDNSGEGQVNFRVNVEEGYEIVSMTAEPEDNYKNFKGSEDTGVEGIYRITKITGDITVTIEAQLADESTEDGDSDADTDDDTEEEDAAVAASIDSETIWSYWDDEEDPAGDSTAEDYDRTIWTLASFDVSEWKTGVCAFGAKNGELKSLSGGLMPVTLLTQYKEGGDYDSGTEENIECYFFRTTIEIEDASAIEQIKGYIYYDDTATIYINGVKVAGFSDDDTITENMVYVDGDAGDTEFSITDEELLAALVDGENIIAVEVHNCNATSSDIFFDMEYMDFRTEVAEEETEEGSENTPDEAQSSVSIQVGVDETERNITWYYNVEGEGTLYLAKESDLVNGEMPADAASYTVTGESTNKEYYYSFQVTVADLEEDTTYAYQVVNGDVTSEIYTFETSVSDGSFSFALAGDPQLGCSILATDVENWNNTLNIVCTNSLFEGVDFLLSAGDQVQTASDEEEYDGFLENEYLSSLAIATVVGNHDSSSSAYSEHFYTTSDTTNTSSYGSTDAGDDYYFVYEGVLFLVLNSNNTSTAEHKAFMEEAIAATADQDITWKVVTFHHSIYSVASHSLEDSIIQRREELVPVFEELDIDVVLMGHDHVYVRTYIMDGLEVSEDEDYEYDEDGVPVSVTDTDGILYVTANSSSASKFYDIKTNVNFEYAAVMNQDYIANISLVTVTESSFSITTYETNSMTEVDSFTIYRSEEEEDDTDDTEDGETSYNVEVSVVDAEGNTSVFSTYIGSTAEVSENSDGTYDVTFTVAAVAAEYIEQIAAEGTVLTVNEDGSYTVTVDSVEEGTLIEISMTSSMIGGTYTLYLLIGAEAEDTEDTDTDVPDESQSSISLSVGSDETERGITWYYNVEGEGTLYLAKESDLVDGEMPEDAVTYTVTGESTNKEGYYSFQVTMTDLEESTTYAYQVVNGDVVSEIYTFETGASNGSFSFALAGDPQIGAGVTETDIEGWENTLNIVSTNSIFESIDFLLSVGDQVNTASSEDEYDGFLEHTALLSLPIATVIGNHDSNSSAYSEHFNITNESEYGTTTAGGDYYYVYEGVLFMVLNSNNTSTAEHKAFMEEAIAATADQDITWKVVTFHHSIYSVASHSLEDSIIQRREQLVPVFEELDIDVVLMGHDHVYARTYIMDGLEVSEDEDYEYDEDGVPISVTDTDGILYVTVNSASGSKYYDIKTDQNFEYAAVMNQDYVPNISLVTVTETSFTITTYETSGMTEVDSFTIYRSSDSEDDDDTDDTEDTDTTGKYNQTDDLEENEDGVIDGGTSGDSEDTGSTDDAGSTDSGSTDNGSTDSGSSDSGSSGSGSGDSGSTDSGSSGSGSTDSGSSDSGSTDDGSTDSGDDSAQTDLINGLKNTNGSWYWYVNSEIASDYTGLVYNDQTYGGAAGWYYVKNGKVDFTYTGLVKHDAKYGGKAGWYYVKNAYVDFTVTDVVYNNGTYGTAGWWYVKNAKVDFSYSGLVKHSADNGGVAGWYYVKNAYVTFSYTGLVYNNGTYGVKGWWYVKSAKVDFSVTGLVYNPGTYGVAGYWYVKNAKVDFSYSGPYVYNTVIFTIKNGQVIS